MSKHKIKPVAFGLSSPEEKYQPSISFPVSKEQLKALTLGEKVEVVFQGKVKSLDQREEGSEVGMEITSVEVTEENEFTEMDE